MSAPVGKLLVQARLLREQHPVENIWLEGHWCDGCAVAHSLADLIDSLLGTYSEAVGRYDRYEVGAQSAADVMEVVLERLSGYVTAVVGPVPV